MLPQITPDNTTFVLLSFEGPDVYSQAGGLGVRMAELGRALAQQGYYAHLYFVGDPSLPSEEAWEDGRFILHRWSQWISSYNPAGVYQGEKDKMDDYQKSVPPNVVDHIVGPNAGGNRLTVFLAEEWHTVSTVLHLHHLLHYRWIRNRALIYWNANNTYGFNLFNWEALKESATITTVSKYMKHKMWPYGCNPLVIPNGIPARLLDPVDETKVNALREAFADHVLLAKIGRYDPDKRWIMAIEAVAALKHIGMRPKIIVRGGMEPHRADIFNLARRAGLNWHEVRLQNTSFENIVNTLAAARDADVLELRFFVPEEFLRVLYAAADGVLANSGHEPFGLVGLEVMACGGIAYTGSTGEDYAQSFHNAVVIDSDDAREIATYVMKLQSRPDLKQHLRHNGWLTAQTFLWKDAIEALTRKLEFTALVEGTYWQS